MQKVNYSTQTQSDTSAVKTNKVSSWFSQASKKTSSAFKKAGNSMKNWSVGKWVYVSLWILTAIFLIVTIVLLVAWADSSVATTITGGTELTSEATLQQNVIASITFITVVLLVAAVFSTTIECYLKKKRGGR